MLGTIAGNLLPLRIVSALSVALFGMFLAIIVPPSRKNKTLLGIVLVSFAASFAFAYIPVINQIDEGTRTIILTIVISAAAALLFLSKKRRKTKMSHNPYIYILIMAAVTFAIRVLPLTLVKSSLQTHLCVRFSTMCRM